MLVGALKPQEHMHTMGWVSRLRRPSPTSKVTWKPLKNATLLVNLSEATRRKILPGSPVHTGCRVWVFFLFLEIVQITLAQVSIESV